MVLGEIVRQGQRVLREPLLILGGRGRPTERQQEVGSGEESGSAAVQAAQKSLGGTLNLLA